MNDALERWLAAARSDEAAAARAREWWLSTQAGEEASFAATLIDLAEAGADVVVLNTLGRRRTGTMRAVGTDFVLLWTAQGPVLIATASIGSVGAERRSGSLGDRPLAPLGVTAGDLLADLTAERPRVRIVTSAGDAATNGDLRSVGYDVVEVDGDDGRVHSIRLSAIAEVTFPA